MNNEDRIELQKLGLNMLHRVKPESLADAGYKGAVAILGVPLPRLMREAVVLRRRKIALNRAEAVEGAFDYILHLATKGKYDRTGEVWLDKEGGEARAFCSSGHSEDNLVAAGKE